MQNSKQDRAIVVGAGIGGLLAARVLSEDFRQVTVLERDNLSSGGEHRRGVPQGRHTHGLLASGRQVLDELFPGITERLVTAGAVTGDVLREGRWYFEGGTLARRTSGIQGILLSRPMLERAVREQVTALPNVEIREGCHAERLVATPDKRRVTGVRVAGQVIPADLVVDSAGRGCDSSAWLQALGYDAPDEERVEIGLAYTTRLFRRRPEHLGGDLAVIIPPTPTAKRGGVMMAQEGDRWTVTLITHFCGAAPGDLPGFIDFTRSLPAPDIHEVVRDAEPLGEPATARFPASTRRRYERLKHIPEGYLVFGDAICSFNPIYGQGMSVAALQSLELRRALRAGHANPGLHFYRLAARVIDTPWSIAVGNDLRMPETIGRRNAGVRFVNWYLSKLHRAAHHDPALSIAFLQVSNLLAPPPSVMRPANLLRVARGSFHLRQTEAPQDRQAHANAAH